MDTKGVYKPERNGIYRKGSERVQQSKSHHDYISHKIQEHKANLHFVCNGKIVETLEHDVSFAWANSRKRDLQHTIPYNKGKLVVVSIYAKDQINGGRRKSSTT
jgi:hypothetical protein